MIGIRLFAGANTAKGFFSFYNYLARDSSARVFILKGGPGTGKSTLLKKVAEVLEPEHTVDRFYCSADVNSLDGVYIHGLDVSILDGTAPHVTDPRLPGAVQQIVDLGTCWNPQELINNRNTIQDLTNSISQCYKVAYKWLGLAAGQADLVQELERTRISQRQSAADADSIAKLLPREAAGLDWQAFATAITGNGLVNFLPDLHKNTPTNVFLVGGNRAYNNWILQSIRKQLLVREIPALYLYCGLQPEHLEHICIPGVFGLYSAHRPHSLETNAMVYGPAEPPESALGQQLFESIQQAVAVLTEARHLHMELEKYYVPHVDFACVELKREQMLRQINAIKTQ